MANLPLSRSWSAFEAIACTSDAAYYNVFFMKAVSPREDHLLKNADVSALESLVAGSISGAVARYVRRIPTYQFILTPGPSLLR